MQKQTEKCKACADSIYFARCSINLTLIFTKVKIVIHNLFVFFCFWLLCLMAYEPSQAILVEQQ